MARSLSLAHAALILALAAGALRADDDLAALNARGVELLRAKRYAEAAAVLARAHALAPTEPAVAANLAQARASLGIELLGQGRTADGLHALRAAHELAPGSTDVRFWLGVAYYRHRDFAAAAVELRALLDTEPGRVQAWEYLGFCHYQRDQLAKARAAWDAALALAPADALLARWKAKLAREEPVERDLTDHLTARFKVRHAPDQAGIARDLGPVLEDAYRDLADRFAIRPAGPITVVLYTDAAFLRATGSSRWVGGLYDGKLRLLAEPLDLPGGTIRRVARHELVHLFVGSLALACPAWLNEGLAQWLEPADPSRDKLGLARALAADRLHPMADLSADLQALGEADRIALAYAQSLSFVAFLQAKGSLEGVLDLVRAPTQGRSLDDACRARYRVGFAELEAEWRGTLSGR